jgi:F420-dependent oxidoreductase-like protein
VATWLRHPLMLASQSLTVQEAIGNRLTLGVGLAHKAPIETTFGIPFDRPAKHMEEYLDVLLPAMRERSVDATGDIWSAHVPTFGGMPAAQPPSVMLAAMGPRMLSLAGSRTDGLILWLSGPKSIESTLKPAVDAAAAEAGRPAPRIVASVPVCVTNRADDVRNLIATFLAGYNELPSYRGVMDIEGVDGPAGVSVIGTEAEVRAGIAAFEDAGTTDFAPVEVTTDDSEQRATRALLKELAAASR